MKRYNITKPGTDCPTDSYKERGNGPWFRYRENNSALGPLSPKEKTDSSRQGCRACGIALYSASSGVIQRMFQSSARDWLSQIDQCVISFFLKLLTGGLLLSLLSCSHPNPTITLTNNTSLSRTDEPLTLLRETIIEKAGSIPNGQRPLLISANGDTIASQLDDLDNDGNWDELAFLADIPADTSLGISLKFINADDYPDFTPRTNIRFGVMDDSGIRNRKKLTLTRNELPVPLYTMFQMDGPAVENDKIGFRYYMDGRNAMDLFGKTSSKMALDTVGISPKNELVDNYHVMEYWGRDILSVGHSLGIGGLAMLNKGKAIRLGVRTNASRNNIDTTKYQLITEGPVRSIYKLTYKGWHVGDKTFDLENQISIWGGHYWYGSKVTLHNSQQPDTLVVGLANSNNDKPLMVLENDTPDWVGLATHDKQTYDKEWYLGLALILSTKNYLTYHKAPEMGPGITTSYNALLRMNNNESLQYYTLAGWEISNKNFADRAYFKKFTKNTIIKIQHPVTIE